MIPVCRCRHLHVLNGNMLQMLSACSSVFEGGKHQWNAGPEEGVRDTRQMHAESGISHSYHASDYSTINLPVKMSRCTVGSETDHKQKTLLLLDDKMSTGMVRGVDSHGLRSMPRNGCLCLRCGVHLSSIWR